jgi:hypothetical protein
VQYLYLDEQKTDIEGERGQRNIVVQLFKIARHPDPTQWPDLKEETNRLICDCLAHPFQEQVLKDLNIWLRHHAKLAGIPSKVDPFSKDPNMLQAILSWKERTMAEGKAEGKVESLLELHRDGLIQRQDVLLRLRHLHDQRQIPDALFETVMRQFGAE